MYCLPWIRICCLNWGDSPMSWVKIIVANSLTYIIVFLTGYFMLSRWCHQMETFSTLLALCNLLVSNEFPSQRPVMWSFDVSFDLCLNNGWVNNREAGDLRCHHALYDVTVMNPWTWLKQTSTAHYTILPRIAFTIMKSHGPEVLASTPIVFACTDLPEVDIHQNIEYQPSTTQYTLEWIVGGMRSIFEGDTGRRGIIFLHITDVICKKIIPLLLVRLRIT